MALLEFVWDEGVGFEGPVVEVLGPFFGEVVVVVVGVAGVVVVVVPVGEVVVVVNGAVVPTSTWIRVKVSVSVTTTPLSVPEQTATFPESEQPMARVVRPWVKLTGAT